MVITRFAPSPTGNFHMGSLRTAIYNYLYARKNNGKFILRIEDTDIERSKKEYENEILNIFKIFKLDFDQLHYQTNNKIKHLEYLDKLIKMGMAFKEEEGPYRFKVDRSKEYFEYTDLILGDIKIPSKNIEDFSIARSDKNPTFILTNTIDDHLEKVSHVIRGNDHSINTIKQKLVSEALELNSIQYAHIPLIHDKSGKKLSKRNNITNVLDYIDDGYLVKSIFNFIVKLGNNFNDIEFLDISNAIHNFELSKTVLSPAKFDIEKLNFINQNNLRQLSLNDFKSHISEMNITLIGKLNIEIVYQAILERCILLKDINIEINNLLSFYKENSLVETNEEEKEFIKKIYLVIQDIPSVDNIFETLEQNGLALKKIGKIIRKIFVNFESKLPIDKIILFYGIGNFKERLLLYIND